MLTTAIFFTMQITLELPDFLTQTDNFHEADWMREITIVLFHQERITLDRASNSPNRILTLDTNLPVQPSNLALF